MAPNAQRIITLLQRTLTEPGPRKVGFWLVVTVVGVLTASAAVGAMDQKFTVPGREGWKANQAIAQRFGGTGGDAAPLVPVVTLHSGKRASDPDVQRELAALEARLTKACPAPGSPALPPPIRPGSVPPTAGRRLSWPTRSPIPPSPSVRTQRPSRPHKLPFAA